MMETEVVLCADSSSLQNPTLFGLEEENLQAQKWLRVFCSAVEARNYIRASSKVGEAWVASSDDIDPINLAAALKLDSHEKGVYLVTSQNSGSLKSRANAAGLDGMLSQRDFIDRYNHYKHLSQSPFAVIPQSKSNLSFQDAFSSTNGAETASLPRQSAPLIARSTSGKSAHVLSVVSASGGAGKSTIAALSALFAQGLGYRTLLIDADLQFGDMHHFLGAKDSITIDRAISDPALLSKLNPEGLLPALLAAPYRLEQSESLGGKLPHLLENLKPYFDVIVLNTGAFWAEQHMSLLERSSTALFVVDQTPSSLRACKHALDLCIRCGIATHPFLFAINHCSRNAPLTSIDVSCALQGSHVVELQEGGKQVSELLGAGMPFELIETRNNLCLSIEKMLLEILPKNENLSQQRNEGKRDRKRFKVTRRKRSVACL